METMEERIYRKMLEIEEKSEKAKSASEAVFSTMAENEQIDEDTISSHANLFKLWGTGKKYSKNKIVFYNNRLYRCLKEHLSKEDYKPDASSEFWKVIGNPLDQWKEWIKPLEESEAYKKFDKVIKDGKKWISEIENNTAEPGGEGWVEFLENNN